MASDKIKNLYFAAKEPKDCAQVIMSKINGYIAAMNVSNFQLKLRRSWMFFHGAYHTTASAAHQITFSGEQGEITQLAINHYRNLAEHMKVMITSNRPALEARAVNTDYKSLVQATLGNGLLDYYMREKRLEVYLKDAVEYAIVLGAGFIKMEWNSTAGDAYEYDEESQQDIYQGDVEFKVLSPFDVVFDTTKNDDKHDWIITRSFKNRFDLMAKYPEMENEIDSVGARNDLFKFGQWANLEETDDIAVYEFFHRRTEALPDGRYMVLLSGDVVLVDGPIPYRDLPVYRIAPSNILGTPFGYTPLFDIMPIQEAINSLYTTILTNQNAFGVQNILNPRGNDVVVNQLEGGLNFIEYNSQFGKPEPINLTQTPKEIFDFLGMLERVAETISGVNSVARGNPEASLKSGTALALVQSMALQFMSGLQQSYVMLIEQVGTGLINMLKDFAKAPRIAAIVGKSHRTELKEFNGDDLNLVNRVVVDMGNPLSRTTAGRVQMAEQLLQMQAIKTPQQYLQVINTGKLEVMTEDTTSELMLIRSENERLLDGGFVNAVFLDNHPLHINEHKTVLNDPAMREDPELVQKVLAHIQQHINLLRTTDPQLLMMAGMQPLQDPNALPPPGSPEMQPPAPGQGAPAQVMQQAPAAPEVGEAGLPNQPVPPSPFDTLPVTADQMIPG